MGQSKIGWWIAGGCAAIVFISIGYGMGRRAAAPSPADISALSPAGAPTPTIQIEPIRPQEELAAIMPSTLDTRGPAVNNPTAAGAAVPSLATGLPLEESARVREIQQALRAAGYDPGPADGRMGPRTQTAIRDFQLANGLEADGKVGPRTWSKLESFVKQTND